MTSPNTSGDNIGWSNICSSEGHNKNKLDRASNNTNNFHAFAAGFLTRAMVPKITTTMTQIDDRKNAKQNIGKMIPHIIEATAKPLPILAESFLDMLSIYRLMLK